MTTRMLIDGTHPEETRVVVATGKRLEEYDIETSTKTQLKGNIYLAKVTRVEPSLQAAFVDFGGNRHGFLAFNEIHPDYYQIPLEDREALLADQAELAKNAEAAQAHLDEIDGDVSATDETPEDETNGEEADNEEGADEKADAATDAAEGEDGAEDEPKPSGRRKARRRPQHRYAIQEVIKRRQIILIQVIKEERGNKGAALTTYLSLAGRYCVLMPNAARGGGISRKITSATDRRRLKNLLNDLDISDSMGVIMRTAGMERKKVEIKRDFDYLMRVWTEVRELTLESAAPALVYEEGNLIKRAIRDLYTNEIDEVLVEGNEAYQSAKKLMRLLMPSHAKRVQPYRGEPMPLYHRYQVEDQLEAMHSPEVHLKSGGYIVINPTEALVAVDVNSGRATRERNIEETARKTNLEAAAEIALQLRLRDLAGLIVIDFIDMEQSRNQRAVEKRLKEAMKNDRARIQLGRISPFGLFELSRQRLRPSLMEASSEICQVCQGSGHVRSTESAAVRVLRTVEEEGIRQRSSTINVTVSSLIALYLLNQKRSALTEIEKRYDIQVMVNGDDEIPSNEMRVERSRDGAAARGDDRSEAKTGDSKAKNGDAAETAKGTGRKKRTRRRRGKGAAAASDTPDSDSASETAGDDEGANATAADDADDKKSGTRRKSSKSAKADEATVEAPTKRRRRGKRGGRRYNQRAAKSGEQVAEETPSEQTPATTGNPAQDAQPEMAADAGPVAKPAEEPVAEPAVKPTPETTIEVVETVKGTAGSNGSGKGSDEAAPPADEESVGATAQPRRGWWNRNTG